jgi:hypothetical protein
MVVDHPHQPVDAVGPRPPVGRVVVAGGQGAGRSRRERATQGSGSARERAEGFENRFEKEILGSAVIAEIGQGKMVPTIDALNEWSMIVER